MQTITLANIGPEMTIIIAKRRLSKNQERNNKPLDVGLFRHSHDNKDVCGDTDIGNMPTPMLLFQSLDPNMHTEEVLYNLVNKN